MDPARRTALVAGVLYLVTFVSAIPAVFLLDPVLSNPSYITSDGADTQVLFGAFLDLVNALAGIGTAVALFSVVKRQHEGFALGFVTTRIYEAAVIVVGVMSILAVVTLRQSGAAAGTDARSLVAVGQALVAVRDWTFLLGPGFAPALNAVLLGYLMYRSRLVPRVIPALGLIGAPLLASSTLGIMFGINETGSLWQGIATAPIFLWELSLGLWMAIKGFDPAAPILGANVVPTHHEIASDRIRALEEVLALTEAAHGEYETTELNGVYDQEWPQWYAQFAIDHGIGTLLGRAVSTDELARFLASSWDELQHADPRPRDPWSGYTARRIVAEL